MPKLTEIRGLGQYCTPYSKNMGQISMVPNGFRRSCFDISDVRFT